MFVLILVIFNKFIVAADWDLFIITTSVLAEGLLDDPIFECWMEYRKGYMLHVHNPSMTGKERKAASEAFRNFGELAEEVKTNLVSEK